MNEEKSIGDLRYEAELEAIKDSGALVPVDYGQEYCKHGTPITEYDCDCWRCEIGDID